MSASLAEALPAELAADWRRLEPLAELISLFLPSTWRVTLPAWGLLLHEIESAALDLSEPHLAEIKLAWWRDELLQARRGQPRHPLTQALQVAGWMEKAPAGAWTDLVQGGLELAADSDSTPDLDGQISRFACLTQPAAELECRLFGGDATATARVHGVHLALDQWIHARRRQRQPWPLDLVARHGASPAADVEPSVLEAMARDHARRLRAGLTADARASAYRALAAVSRALLLVQLQRSGRPGELAVRPGPLAALAVWRRARSVLRRPSRA